MNPAQASPDFSIVLGGPLYQFWRGTRLTDDALRFLRRRLLATVAVAWVPLLLLSVAAGQAWGNGVDMPFLHDVELQVRLLIAMPLMIVAELVVHQRIRPIVRQFLDRGLIPDAAKPQFDAAISSAVRLRNSLVAEVLLVALVYFVGVGLFWRTQVALGVTSWYATYADGTLQTSTAGWWLGLVSLPLFQFLLLRWYFRLFIWARFLWQVSKIDLRFMPTHPDRAGGLGFLDATAAAFSPVLVAQGALLAGMIGSQILYTHATLPEFKLEIIGLVTLLLFAILGPMLVFSPGLAAAKRAHLHEFGILAQRYVREFDDKWLRRGAPGGEPLLGSPDIQSLADLSSSFEVVRSMRWMPFTASTVVQLAGATVGPLLPLALTMFSAQELLERLLKIVF